MAFCKELFKAETPTKYPRATMTPEERKAARRAWWETEVDDTLEGLMSSVRMQRLIIALLLIVLAIK